MPLFQPNPKPTNKELRWFAGLWFPAFWGTVGLFFLRHHASAVAVSIWGVTMVLTIAGLLVPAMIRPWYNLMMRATYPIGWTMSYVILGAVYFLIITPMGYLMRRSHDPMRRKFEPSVKSYWIDCEPANRDRYFRQM
jgi:hypothetical protein